MSNPSYSSSAPSSTSPDCTPLSVNPPVDSSISSPASRSSSVLDISPDRVVSISELIDRFEREEAEIIAGTRLASAVGDGVNQCSYPVGPHTQPVYACLTCYPKGEIGICFACSMNCHGHGGHEIIELFDKRDFVCDCGNEKAKQQCVQECELYKDKEAYNTRNKYNQNFRGLYCHCNGIYREGEEIMIQCLGDEDWYHLTGCIQTGSETPEPSEEQQFLCRICMNSQRFDFLLPYIYTGNNPIVNPIVQSHKEIPLPSDSLGWFCDCNTGFQNFPESTSCSLCEKPRANKQEKSPKSPNRKRKADEISDVSTPAASREEIVCNRPINRSFIPSALRDSFLPSNITQRLCRCSSCLSLYASRDLSFLVEDDSAGSGPNGTPTTGQNALDAIRQFSTSSEPINSPDHHIVPPSFDEAIMARFPRDKALMILERWYAYRSQITRQIEELAQRGGSDPSNLVINRQMIEIITEQARNQSEIRQPIFEDPEMDNGNSSYTEE
jgi:E3 ubiquitin-protein ligase UBR7